MKTCKQLPMAADSLQSGRLADASRGGGLHLPPLMLQGRGFTSSNGVPTSLGPQIRPSRVAICMGRAQAIRETSNMRRVGTNNDPWMLPNGFWGVWPENRGLLISGLALNRFLEDPLGQGGSEGSPEQPELLSMLTPERPLGKVGVGGWKGFL